MSARVLLIDNYDSFVFNLARYMEELGVETEVVRNDSITVEGILARAPGALVLSPGPCTPDEAGVCMEVVRQLGKTLPMLGVCLGHQAIGAALGGNIVRAAEPVHGRTSQIQHDEQGVFAGCPQQIQVTRYHSLIVERATLPDCLKITAWTPDGTIMALQHHHWPVYGVQFHPESILTQQGHRLLKNFLNLAGIPAEEPVPAGDLTIGPGSSPASEDDFYRREIGPPGAAPYSWPHDSPRSESST